MTTAERLTQIATDVAVIRERVEALTRDRAELDHRVTVLERWQWRVAGLAVGLGAGVSSGVTLAVDAAARTLP